MFARSLGRDNVRGIQNGTFSIRIPRALISSWARRGEWYIIYGIYIIYI